jgi:8-oxo-dGTP diphosphatase
MKNTADGILFKEGTIVLIRRAGKTFHNYWALPGGFHDNGETIEETLTREMKEELGVDVEPKDILGVYSAVDRDPRGQTISTVFICDYVGVLAAGDDAADYTVCSITEALALELAFDHRLILQDFQKWLQSKGTFWSLKERP